MKHKIALGLLGYAALLGLTWLLWWLFSLVVFLVLLWVFASPLLLVLLVLTLTLILISIPIRYQARGQTAPGGHTLHAKFSYCFKLVRGGFTYENGKGVPALYIAWFNLFKKEDPATAQPAQEGGSPTIAKLLSVLESVSEPEAKPSAEKPPEKPPEKEPQKKETPKEAVPKKEASPKKTLKKPSEKSAEKTSEKFLDKLRDIRAMKDKIWGYPNRKVITGLLLGAVKKILKALKPQKLDVSGVIGFADPSKTGMLLGVYQYAAALLGIRRQVRLRGNFDAATTDIRLQGHIKGRIRIIRLLWPVAGLWLKKPIRILIKDLRRKGE